MTTIPWRISLVRPMIWFCFTQEECGIVPMMIVFDSADVIGYVEAEAVNLQSGSQVNGVAIATQDDPNWSSIANRPAGLDDGDDVSKL